jgi:tRNA nucleotidyltransferase (CCA-adding enzyme)
VATRIGANWEHFSHEADMGVRGRGSSREQAFEQAALALVALTVDPGRVEPVEEVKIACQAPDQEVLLVDWLNACVYEMATRKMVFGRFEVELADNRLAARAWGEKVEPARHALGVEVKGATYTELRVGQDDEGRWTAQCVVDV